MNDDLIPVYAALGDPTRLAIVESLADAPSPANTLSGPVLLTQQGLSKHLQVLVEAGLVRQEKRGRQRVCSVDQETLAAAIAWLQEQAAGPKSTATVMTFDPTLD